MLIGAEAGAGLAGAPVPAARTGLDPLARTLTAGRGPALDAAGPTAAPARQRRTTAAAAAAAAEAAAAAAAAAPEVEPGPASRRPIPAAIPRHAAVASVIRAPPV